MKWGAPLAEKVPGQLELDLDVSEPVGVLGGQATLGMRQFQSVLFPREPIDVSHQVIIVHDFLLPFEAATRPKHMMAQGTRRPKTGTWQISNVRATVAPRAAER